MPFDIRQLRYAIAAADHGSFYRASRALDVEQSTLSRAVLKLERVIGNNIFNRSQAGVTMTIAGAQFIRAARPMVANAEKMVAMMRAAGQGRAGGLMIGHNTAISAGHLRATMLGWRAANPDVEIDGVEADRGALLAGLDTGEIDIAILVGEAGHAGFRREGFWNERVIAALPADHALAASEVVHWTDLRRERFLLPAADPGPEIRDILLGRLMMAGEPPDIRMHQASREAILSVLGGGLGVSIICEGGTGARYPDVVYRPIRGEQGPAFVSYSGYWREDNGNPALRRFLAFVRNRHALSFDIP
ncbi:LysR family transcriptional regulator [Sphingomonadales bacterium 58]|uniref:LysR family transcriptional regulator n=1 Tax=Sphingobium sp. S8 TaxID=2758385 RepID=UPI0019188100|nr:LysR family transcriptional regulator [Sphingobium sp. S8]MBY2958969.1 LysR family transcriptional regulator [Sphingomonadales bacterium 58]CAD7338152.1 Hydrogen peroxide-inducible genes activator [Sphingobium sp. S8]